MLLHFPATQVDHPALIDSDESVVMVKSEREEPWQKVLSSKGKAKDVRHWHSGKTVVMCLSDSS
jgi:hypothetical protein